MAEAKTKNNGGARKGAGRPVLTKTLITQRLKDLLAKRVEARFGPMIDAQLDSAIGIMLQKSDRKTGNLYYQDEAPSTNAAKFLTEQLLGRPKESIEHSGEVKGLVGLITDLNNGNSGTQ